MASCRNEGCRAPVTWRETRTGYGRLLRGGLIAPEIKALTPLCRGCVRTVLDNLNQPRPRRPLWLNKLISIPVETPD